MQFGSIIYPSIWEMTKCPSVFSPLPLRAFLSVLSLIHVKLFAVTVNRYPLSSIFNSHNKAECAGLFSFSHSQPQTGWFKLFKEKTTHVCSARINRFFYPFQSIFFFLQYFHFMVDFPLPVVIIDRHNFVELLFFLQYICFLFVQFSHKCFFSFDNFDLFHSCSIDCWPLLSSVSIVTITHNLSQSAWKSFITDSKISFI